MDVGFGRSFIPRRDSMPIAMSRGIVLAIVLASVVGDVLASIGPPRVSDGARALEARRRETTFASSSSSSRSSQSSQSRERWFDGQRLNHFDAADLRMWSQRYFINDHRDRESADEAPAVVFLCVGGEGPALTARVVEDGGEHCAIATSLATRKKGVVFALEHRFYGASQPTGDLSMSSLRYLSSQQALEDVVAFLAHARERYDLRKSRVVAFGGSYPGMLAAWARIKYPHAIHASVASSAPIRAEVDMRGYYDVVGAALREEDVGGSDECRDAVREAFERGLNEALKTAEGRRGLERRFNVCGERALDGFGGRDAFGEILRAMFPAQSNDPSCAKDDDSCFNIAKACEAMTSKEDKLDALATYVSRVFRGRCVPLESEAYIAALSSTTPDPTGEGERQWTWQTCTEFAFFQTCEADSECPFKLDPPTMPLASYFWICAKFFGISEEQTRRAVANTNARYGGDAPGGTRILFPSGSVDPWIANSFTSQTFAPRWEPAFVVPGASHHAWTHPPRDSDSDAVKRARAKIEARVDAWLDEGPMRSSAGSLRVAARV